MTKQEYINNIPDCCRYRTYEDHYNYMALCWGISAGFVTKDHDCGRDCPEHKDHDPELLRAILEQKEKG